MVHSTIRMLIPSRKRDEVLGFLNAVVERCKFEQGCISCRLYQGVEVEHLILLDQLWEKEKDLERHLQSDEYHKVLLAVDMALEPPEIRFETISRTTGFETIKKARSVAPKGGRA